MHVFEEGMQMREKQKAALDRKALGLGLLISWAIWGQSVHAAVCLTSDLNPIQELLHEVQHFSSENQSESQSLNFKPPSGAIQEVRQIFYQRWLEENELGSLSIETQRNYQRTLSQLGLRPNERQEDSHLERAVNRILSNYLRWSSADTKASFELADFPLGLDKSLLEFFELSEDDPRSLSELIFSDLLRSSSGRRKLLELSSILDRMFGRVSQFSILVGPEMTERFYRQAMLRPEIEKGLFISRKGFPSLSVMKSILNEIDFVIAEFGGSLPAYVDLYRTKLKSFVDRAGLSWGFVLEAFNFNATEVREMEKAKALSQKIEVLSSELNSMQASRRLDLLRRSPFRMNTSLRDVLTDQIDLVRMERGPMMEVDSLANLDFLQDQLISNQDDVFLTSFEKLKSLYLDPVASKIKAEFTQVFEKRTYDSREFANKRHADPRVFLGPHADFENGRWVRVQWVTRVGGRSSAMLAQPDLAPNSRSMLESRVEEFDERVSQPISKEEFERLQAEAVKKRLLEELSASSAFVDEKRLSLRRVIGEAKIYGSEGFFSDGEEFSKNKIWIERWYDPILERFRNPKDDPIDFEQEVLPKARLILSILEADSISEEMAFLLTWKQEDLLKLAVLRKTHKDFSKNSDLLKWRATKLPFENFSEFIQKAIVWKTRIQAEGLDSLDFRFASLQELDEALSQFDQVVRRRKQILPGTRLSDLDCGNLKAISKMNLSGPIESLTIEDYYRMWNSESSTRDRSRFHFQSKNSKDLISAADQCLDVWATKRDQMAASLDRLFRQELDKNQRLLTHRYRNLGRALEAFLNQEDWEALLLNSAGTTENLADVLNEITRRDVRGESQRLENLLRKVLSPDARSLSETERILRQKIVEFFGEDLSSLVGTLRSGGSLRQAFLVANENLASLQAASFKSWSVYEIQALEYLARNQLWDQFVVTGSESLDTEDLFRWLARNLKRDEEGRLSVLDFEAAANLMDSADSLAISNAIVPQIWGDDWQSRIEEEGTPMQMREYGMLRAKAIVDFIVKHQHHLIPYLSGSVGFFDGPIQLDSRVNQAFQVSHEGLDVLKRWGVPNDPQQIERLIAAGDRIAWQNYIEFYLSQLTPEEAQKKREEFKNLKRFPPAEVTRWLLEKNREGDLNFFILNSKTTQDVYEKMGIFGPETSQVFAKHSEKTYSAHLATFFEQGIQQALLPSLLGYDEFLIDFFDDPEKVGAKEIAQFFNGRPPSGSAAAERFLSLLGLQLGSHRPPSLIRQSMARIKKDNRKLWQDLEETATRFFQSQVLLFSGPLTREDLGQLVVFSKDPEVTHLLLGMNEFGQIKEGSDVSRKTAESLLVKTGKDPKAYDLKKVQEQLTRLRAFLLSANQLFPIFQASLSENLISYLTLDILKTLNQDRSLVEGLMIDHLDNQIHQRMKDLEILILELGMKNERVPSDFEDFLRDSVQGFSLDLRTLARDNDVNADLVFEAFKSFFEAVVLPRSLPGHPVANLSTESYQELVKDALSALESRFGPLANQDSLKNLFQILKASPKKSLDQQVAAAFERAFPVEPGQNQLISIYSQANQFVENQEAILIDKIESIFRPMVRDSGARKRRLIRRAIPFDELFVKSDKIEEALHDTERIAPSLEKTFLFLNQQKPEFFMQSQRSDSVEGLLRFLLGDKDKEVLFSRLSFNDRRLVNEAAAFNIDLWNKAQIRNWGQSKEVLFPDFYDEFFKYSTRTHLESVKNVLSLLAETDDPELATLLTDSIRERLRGSFSTESFKAFLSKMEVSEAQRQVMIQDPSLELRLQTLKDLNSGLMMLFNLLTAGASRLDAEQTRKQAIAALLPRLKEGLMLEETIGRQTPGSSRVLNLDLLLEGMERRMKSDLELNYDQIKIQRAERKRIDSGFFLNLFQDIGYMFVEGVAQMGAEGYRLLVENAVVNGLGLFTGHSYSTDMARRMAETLGLENISNFSKERVLRDSDDVLSELIADGVGLFVLAGSFGGFRAAGMALSGASRGLQAVSRPGFNVARFQQGFSQNPVGALLTKERYFGGFRGPATQRAVAAGIQTQVARFSANPVARVSVEGAWQQAGRAVSDRALRWTPVVGSVAKTTGPRLLIDSALIAAVALGGQYVAYGSLENLADGFGEHFVHGVGFMGTLSLIHLGLHKWPKPNRILSTILIHYIVKDATQNATRSLMVESESFRDLMNVAFGDTNLELRMRKYDELPADYWKSIGLLSKKIPDEEKWAQLQNGQELLAQWSEDQNRIMAAISGSFIVGLIVGSPLVGRALDTATYQRLVASQGKPTAQSRIYETLAQAYGGNSQRYFDWAKRDRLKVLRAEEMKKPERERRSENELEVLAEQFVKENFPRIYEEIHPELMIERMARLWTMQGRPVERLRAEAEASVRYHYERIYNEMHSGALMNPLLTAHFRGQRMLTVEEAVKKFNQAWDSGVRQGQALRMSEFERLEASPGKVSEFFNAFQALGERLDSYLKSRNRSESTAEDLHKILLEFGVDVNTPLGQLLLREIVIPRLQAIESGRLMDPLFHGWDFRSPDVGGKPRLSSSDFAKLIRDQVNDPLAWAEARVLTSDPFEIFRPGEGSPRTEVTGFRSSQSDKPFNVFVYRQDGKRYLEAYQQKIELPDHIEVRMRNNGDLHLIDRTRNRTLQVSESIATDQFGTWGLSTKPAPRISEQLINWVREAEGASVPRMARYDVTRVDPTTGQRRTRPEDVFLIELNKDLQMISLPDGSFLLSYVGEKPVKPPVWRRIFSRQARQEAREIDFVSDVHLPKGWELAKIEGDVFTLRDRFQFEIEIHFRAQKIEVFHRQSDGSRNKIQSFYGQEGQPMGLREFVDQLAYLPGVLPTEVAMAVYLADSGAALKRSTNFFGESRARIEDRILEEQGGVLGMRPEDLVVTTRRRIEAAQKKAIELEKSKTNEIWASEGEALRVSREVLEIPIPEGISKLELIQASEKGVLAKFLSASRFAQLKTETGFRRSEGLEKRARELNLSEAEMVRLEILEFVNSRNARQLSEILSFDEIQLAWRVSTKLKQISEARNSVFEVLRRRDVELAWREMSFLEASAPRLPETIDELQIRFDRKAQWLILRALEAKPAEVIEGIGRRQLAEEVFSSLSIKERNFIGLELFPEGPVREAARASMRERDFRIPEDRLFEGLSDELIKAFLIERLPQLTDSAPIGPKFQEILLHDSNRSIQALRDSRSQDLGPLRRELSELIRNRSIIESWLTSAP